MYDFFPICVTDSLTRRFWKKVHKTDGCWLWTATKTKKGYGKIRFGGAGSHMGLASRVAWAIEHDCDPGKTLVCHTCDNPSCVNPEHLFLGTYVDNNKDMKNKDRHTRGERSGTAKLSETEVRNLKQDYASGMGAMAFIAAKYGICTMQVCRIINGKRWEHVR